MTSSSPRSSRARLYSSLAVLGAASGAWLACAGAAGGDITPCPFKLVTGIACPACGSTRAVLAVFEGHNPLQYNPVGLFTFVLGIAVFTLLVRDLVAGSDVLLRFWGRAEQWIRQPPVALAGITLLSANWIWTISKEL